MPGDQAPASSIWSFGGGGHLETPFPLTPKAKAKPALPPLTAEGSRLRHWLCLFLIFFAHLS
jgi:hypothetical protein